MVIYLLKLFIFRIYMFFVHWYRDGGLFAYGLLLGAWRRIDRLLGVRVTLRFLFTPLYQERNITGYVLGFVFRFFRLGVGSVLLLFSGAGIAILFVAWACLPAYIIVRALRGS